MPATSGNIRRMEREIADAAEVLKSARSAMIISHIDADGISAGSIADITAERLGIEHTVHFEKKITDETVDMVNNSTEDVVWICDLGSGYLSEFTRSGIIITDHHVPDPKWRKKQTVLDNFTEIHHLNPHCYGMDGSYETCGAGMTYLLSKAVDPRNIDLAYLAVVGAVGDFQDSNESRLVSLNRDIVRDAEINGDLTVDDDLRLFGRETRPINQYLQFCNEPHIDGISDNPRGCLEFLDRLHIETKDHGRWRVWDDLSDDEKERVTESLLDMIDYDQRSRLVGEMYTFPDMPAGTGLRDAKEYATVLNSCGRYDDAETGLRICRGDYSALNTAEKNRAEHRRRISAALGYIKENHLVRERRFIQYFDAGDAIMETVVGIVAGMLLNSPECRPNLPIIAFVDAEDGVKVSARTNRALVDKGLDLSQIMKTASGIVGGFGGGHSVAAGATIPPEKKEEFLDIVEDLVSSQIE